MLAPDKRQSEQSRCIKILSPAKSDSFDSAQIPIYIQGVVTLTRPVEPFATGIKIFDRRKITLIALFEVK